MYPKSSDAIDWFTPRSGGRQNRSQMIRSLLIRRLLIGGLLISGFVGSHGIRYASADTVESVVRMHVEGTKGAEDQLAMLRKANRLYVENKFDESLEVLNQAHKKYPHLPDGRVAFALMLMESGRLRPAQQQLEIAVSQGGDFPYAHDAFGRLALTEGRITDAELQFEQARKLIEASGRSQKSKDRFIHQCDLGQATVAEQRGNWAVAQKFLTAALAFDSKDPVARRRRAAAMFHQGKSDQAYTELVKAYSADDTAEPASLMMARLCGEKGEFEQAETWIKRAQLKHPKDHQVPLFYASWLLDRRRIDDAVEQANAAAELAPEDPSVRLLLGQLAISQQEFEQAEKHFQTLHTANPANFEISNLLALALADQNDRDKQRKSVQLAEMNARQYPRNAEALATLGWVYDRMGRKPEAQQQMANAISGGSFSPDNVYLYSRVVFQEDRANEVRQLLQKALDSEGQFLRLRQAEQWVDQLSKSDPAPASTAAGKAGDRSK